MSWYIYVYSFVIVIEKLDEQGNWIDTYEIETLGLDGVE